MRRKSLKVFFSFLIIFGLVLIMTVKHIIHESRSNKTTDALQLASNLAEQINTHSEVCSKIRCYPDQECNVFMTKDSKYFPACLEKVDRLCSKATCLGTCINSTKCICLPGFYGNDCEFNYTVCQTNDYCKEKLNAGTCITFEGGKYSCQCKDGSFGETCNSDMKIMKKPKMDACYKHIGCGGIWCRCVLSNKHKLGYYCVNAAGYIGKDCNIEPPRVSCMSKRIIIEIPKDFATEFNDGELALAYVSPNVNKNAFSSKCAVPLNKRSHSYILSIDWPFSACGNMVDDEEHMANGVVYSNTVWLSGFSYYLHRKPKASFQFYCYEYSYPPDSMVVNPVSVSNNIVGVPWSNRSKGTVRLELCQVSTCMKKCPQHLLIDSNAAYTVGEKIHLSVIKNFNEENSFDVILKQTIISCDRYDYKQHNSVTVTESCARNPSLQVQVESEKESLSCLSFSIPEMKNCSQLYIHTLLTLCEKTESELCINPKHLYCPKAINQSNKANKTDDYDVMHYAIGPMKIIESKTFISTISLVSDSEYLHFNFLPKNVSLLARNTVGQHSEWNVHNILLFILILIILFFVHSKLERKEFLCEMKRFS